MFILLIIGYAYYWAKSCIEIVENLLYMYMYMYLILYIYIYICV